MMWDVIIAGAGPAGSVVAHVLARKGRRVLIVDPLPPRALKIGEALPGAVLRLLRALNLPFPEQNGPHVAIGGNLSCWNSEELVATDFFHDPDGQGWRLDRLQFDSALREAATDSGAIFKQGRLCDFVREEKRWRITLDNGETFTGLWLVDATGRSTSVARKLGAQWLRDAPLIAIYAVGRPPKNIQLNRTVVEAAQNGWWYAGMLPSGLCMVGFHGLPKDAGQLITLPKAWMKALMATSYISQIFRDFSFEFPLRALDASGGRLNHFVGNQWLACGDAAMCFDPVSSRGIMSALHNGMLAANAIHGAMGDDITALHAYKHRLEQMHKIYLLQCRAIYQSVTRWHTPFWLRFKDPALHIENSSSF